MPPRAAKGLKEKGVVGGGGGGTLVLPSIWGKGGGQRKGKRNDEEKKGLLIFRTQNEQQLRNRHQSDPALFYRIFRIHTVF